MNTTETTRYIRDPQEVAPLVDRRWVTHRYEVTLRLTSIAGGLPADPATLLAMPIPDKLEPEEVAQLGTAALLPGPEEAGKATKVFRRSNGHIAVSANQLRTMLSESARALYTGTPGIFTLQKALYSNARIEPGLIELDRSAPDAHYVQGRTIRRPPFERSVVNDAEVVTGDIAIAFELLVCALGYGTMLREEVLRTLFEYAGEQIGLGADRKLAFGRFKVERFELAEERAVKLPTLK